MITYECDNSMMMSYESIKSEILQKDKVIPVIVAPKRNVPNTKNNNENALTLEHLKQDSSVIFAIKSDATLLSLFSSCRKQKSLLSYLYIENHQYITILVKCGHMFPVVIIKIPISNVFAYAINTESCYEFPLSILLSKIPKSKSVNYSIILRKTASGDVLTLETNNGVNKKEVNIENIKSIQLQQLSLVLFNQPTVKLTDSIINMFNNMQILALNVIPLSSELNTIFQTKNNNGKITFFIDNDQMMIRESRINSNENINILSNNPQSRLYWNDAILQNGNEYSIEKYENMFKLNYNKLSSTKSKLYYIFTIFNNTNLFIKLITPLNVGVLNNSLNYTFSNVFDKDSQIVEYYSLIKDSN